MRTITWELAVRQLDKHMGRAIQYAAEGDVRAFTRACGFIKVWQATAIGLASR